MLVNKRATTGSRVIGSRPLLYRLPCVNPFSPHLHLCFLRLVFFLVSCPYFFKECIDLSVELSQVVSSIPDFSLTPRRTFSSLCVTFTINHSLALNVVLSHCRLSFSAELRPTSYITQSRTLMLFNRVSLIPCLVIIKLSPCSPILNLF